VEEQTIEQRRVYEGRVVRLRIDTVRLPDGRTATREVVEHNPAVAMVPVDREGRILLVRQWRSPGGAALLEVPAGTTGGGEGSEAAVPREPQAGIGDRAGARERPGGLWGAPGRRAPAAHRDLAEELAESRLQADDDERIEVVPLTLKEALAAIAAGQIQDAKSQVGLLMYAARLRGG